MRPSATSTQYCSCAARVVKAFESMTCGQLAAVAHTCACGAHYSHVHWCSRRRCVPGGVSTTPPGLQCGQNRYAAAPAATLAAPSCTPCSNVYCNAGEHRTGECAGMHAWPCGSSLGSRSHDSTFVRTHACCMHVYQQAALVDARGCAQS